jgi:hypothetical protein
MRRWRLGILAAVLLAATSARAEEPVALKYTRAELEAKWHARVQSLLDRGVVPLIDLETTLPADDGERYLGDSLKVMDEVGLALVAFDNPQAPPDGKTQGYRWNYYTRRLVNAHPDRFIPTTNGGFNPNWLTQKGGRPIDFIDQLETVVRAGIDVYIGELEFRHFMSDHQCKQQNWSRDVTVPLNSPNGHRVFKLSAETGVPFGVHLEPEDEPLQQLEEMLAAYPKAKVVVAHFGQIRHPERQKRFDPELVRRLLGTYSNLYYDLSTGHPGRRYNCTGEFDTVLWQDQGGTLKPEYKAILTDFSTRFVAGTDYGGGRIPLPVFLRVRVDNLRLILRDLPENAKHNIAYRNAWKLLTGKDWR